MISSWISKNKRTTGRSLRNGGDHCPRVGLYRKKRNQIQEFVRSNHGYCIWAYLMEWRSSLFHYFSRKKTTAVQRPLPNPVNRYLELSTHLCVFVRINYLHTSEKIADRVTTTTVISQLICLVSGTVASLFLFVFSIQKCLLLAYSK